MSPILPSTLRLARPSIWQLALPSILGNLSYTIVGMVQTKFVGELRSGPRRWVPDKESFCHAGYFDGD